MICFPPSGDVYIHPTANIDPSAVVSTLTTTYINICFCTVLSFFISVQLGPNVSIGKGVTIGGGVRVRESIILHGAMLQVQLNASVFTFVTMAIRQQKEKWNWSINIWVFVSGSLLCVEQYCWVGQYSGEMGKSRRNSKWPQSQRPICQDWQRDTVQGWRSNPIHHHPWYENLVELR